MTSPDTSAPTSEEVVALLRAGVGRLQTWPYDAVPTETTISSLCRLLTIGADTLDAMRAERDERMELAEIWHRSYETQLANAEALTAEVIDLKAKLGMAREALAKIVKNYETPWWLEQDARTTLAAIGETKP